MMAVTLVLVLELVESSFFAVLERFLTADDPGPEVEFVIVVVMVILVLYILERENAMNVLKSK